MILDTQSVLNSSSEQSTGNSEMSSSVFLLFHRHLKVFRRPSGRKLLRGLFVLSVLIQAQQHKRRLQ